MTTSTSTLQVDWTGMHPTGERMPSWLWFLIAILVVLAILFLIGLRVHIGG